MDSITGKRQHLAVILLFTFLAVLFFWQLGERPFATPDEARYVEIPREMIATGDFVTPRLNGVKYFEKPPLFYWIQAGFQEVFGLHEWSMRLSVVLFALIGCIATYLFCRRFFDPTTAIFSTLILGTNVLYFSLSRLIILDMPITILVTLALFTFYVAVYTEPSTQRRLWFYAFTAFCALGVLTKGIMTLALSGPVIVLWATFARQWKRVFPAYIPTAILLFLVIAAPWHILAAIKNPEFLYKYFIVEHFMRYTTTVHMRYQPFWYFIPIFLAGFLPWTVFKISSLKHIWQNNYDRSRMLFLLIWMGWVLGFFSFSNSKLIPYILPMFIPVSIFVGIYLAEHWNSKDQENFHSYIIAFVLGISSTILLSASYFFPELNAEKALLAPYIRYTGFIFLGMSCVCLLGKLKFLRNRVVITALLLLQSTNLILMAKGASFLQRPSIKEFATYINIHKKPTDRIVSFMTYYQDLPVYTKQLVTIVEATGELEFGTEVEDTTAWMIKLEQFLKLFKQERMWVVGRESEFKKWQQLYPDFKYSVVLKNQGNLLVTN